MTFARRANKKTTDLPSKGIISFVACELSSTIR
jgi:hypothetical protein